MREKLKVPPRCTYTTPGGVLAYTQDTRSSRLLGYTHTTVTGRTAIQPSFVLYCGTNYLIHNGPGVISSVTAFLVRFFF